MKKYISKLPQRLRSESNERKRLVEEASRLPQTTPIRRSEMEARGSGRVFAEFGREEREMVMFADEFDNAINIQSSLFLIVPQPYSVCTPMQQVTPDQGILKKTVTQGHTSTLITWEKGSLARFTYRTYTFDRNENGKLSRRLIADSDKNDKKMFELRIGMGFSVKMFEIAVKTMVPGEVARFIVLPEYFAGYAEMERSLNLERHGKHVNCAHSALHCCQDTKDLEDIDKAPLELEIEFKELLAPGTFEKEVWEMSYSEKMDEAPRLKQQANQLFNKGLLQDAYVKYTRALTLVESILLSPAMELAEQQVTKAGSIAAAQFNKYPDPQVNPLQVYELLQSLRLNYGLCKLKMEQYSEAIVQFTEVLKRDPTNIKALFRRLMAHLRLEDTQSARKDFEILKGMVPTLQDVATRASLEKDLANEGALLKKIENSQLISEKKMYSKLFT